MAQSVELAVQATVEHQAEALCMLDAALQISAVRMNKEARRLVSGAREEVYRANGKVCQIQPLSQRQQKAA